MHGLFICHPETVSLSTRWEIFFGDFPKNVISLKTQMSILSKTIDIDKYSTDYFHDGIKKIYVLLNFGVFKTKHCCICLIINCRKGI